ncbi:MAG: alkaline phosphatase family protein, partial [Candidatus Micrarchaeia archaeon]
FPDFRRSNVEVAKEVAKGGGSLIGKADEKLFFLVIDALGYDLLEKAMTKSAVLRDSLKNAELKKISTLFPSFTPTLFTSIDSGLLPSQHGIIGSPLPVKEYGTFQDIFGMSWWPVASKTADSASARAMFPNPNTVLRMARNKGFYYLQHEEILRKTKDADAMKRIKALPYISQDDFVFQARSLLKSAKMVYAYIGDIDHAQHVYTKSTVHGFEIVVYGLERIAEKLIQQMKDYGWKLIITADHGQVSMRTSDVVHIGPRSNLMQDLSMPPWGTESTVFFEVTETRQKSFEAQFDRQFGKKFLLYASSEVIKSGLFGKNSVKPWLRYRFGTHVAISKGAYTMKYLKPGAQPLLFDVHGHHGGMTKEEMEVPLLMV